MTPEIIDWKEVYFAAARQFNDELYLNSDCTSQNAWLVRFIIIRLSRYVKT